MLNTFLSLFLPICSHDVNTTHMNWKLHESYDNVTKEKNIFCKQKSLYWYWLPFQINEAVLSLRLVYSAWTSFSFFLKLMRWFMLFLIFLLRRKCKQSSLERAGWKSYSHYRSFYFIFHGKKLFKSHFSYFMVFFIWHLSQN